MYTDCMTMLSFRVDDAEASEALRWASKLGIDKSELLRTALHNYIVRLKSEDDARIWQEMPLNEDEQSLLGINDWGVAEDWSEWVNETR
jgi:hypothetical protein